MYNLVVKDRQRKIGEIYSDFYPDTFKYEYEKNNERQLTLTAFKTYENADLFGLLINESILMWKGQEYVIKSTSIKNDNLMTTNDIVAKHIFMDFSKHYIEKDLENEELNGDTDDKNKPTYSLEQYLDFGFRGNKLGFKYKIIGKFPNRVMIDDLGDKNGMEYLTEGADLFGYIYFADNKTIYIYSEEEFYKRSDEVIRYAENTDEVAIETISTDIQTYIKGYGKKKTTKETKNYSPIKTPSLKLNGTFIKKGTWRTEKVGASYETPIKCNWGNETLEFNLKKGENGGMWDFYLDDNLLFTVTCWYRTTTTERIIVAKNLSKGNHTFKAVFKGADPNINYKKNIPCGYVGTEKATILNLTAVLKGEELYHYKYEYKSPKNYNVFGHSQAPTIYDDNVESQKELEELVQSSLQDEPVVEVSTNYLGFEQIKENHTVRLFHKPLGFNTDIKVVKLTESHPIMNEPVSIEFSNAKKDIIEIHNEMLRRVKSTSSAIKAGKLGLGTSSVKTITSRSVGSV